MKKPIRPAELLETIRVRQKISGQRLLSAFKSLPKVSPIRLSREFDDSDDIYPMLLMLTDAERRKFGIPLQVMRPAPPAPPPSSPQPIYQVRVHAILCANDDGSGGASNPNAVDANYLKQLIDTTNIIYQSAGIQFIYDPTTDFEQVNSSLLNLDFTIPAGLNYNLPESQPPLTEEQVNNLAKSHADERQRIGRQHRHRMVLLFCDGNMLVYDKNQGRWTIIFRTYAFSGEDSEFVALPTGKGDLQGFANLVAHETGHYFHQWHTHGEEVKLSDADMNSLSADQIKTNLVELAAQRIRDYVGHGHSRSEGDRVFDGDLSQVGDTSPDPGPTIFQYVNSDACGASDSVLITAFSDHPPYVLKPDRGNAVSYFKGCLNFKMHFSPEQIAGMRKSMEEENRWHLIHPSMRLDILEAYVLNNHPSYYAVWHPSEEREIQVYGWKYEDYRALYDRMW